MEFPHLSVRPLEQPPGSNASKAPIVAAKVGADPGKTTATALNKRFPQPSAEPS